eukprot:TRINITY_DN16529_c0_g1_i1.p2 TRINITY_DN16529_c0_g1~~TRINITY_DN16529_c0_g1_i1.p2  ORF type:complete len:192 (-),score=34.94 TRINITY_DN16529_c0_g1_i1:190-765(-)
MTSYSMRSGYVNNTTTALSRGNSATETVKCSAATLGANGSAETGADVEVKVTAPDVVLKDMIEYLATRNHLMQGFMERYQRRTDIVQTFQCLAYLMEHCRFTKTNKLIITGDAPRDRNEEAKKYILDLEPLNNRPKRCSKTGCPSMGQINCSRCLITYWCSASCLEECYDSITHRIVCAQAEAHLKTLFPD